MRTALTARRVRPCRALLAGLLAGVWFALAGFAPVLHARYHHCGHPVADGGPHHGPNLDLGGDDDSCPLCRFATAPAALACEPTPPVRAVTRLARPETVTTPRAGTIAARGRAPPTV